MASVIVIIFALFGILNFILILGTGKSRNRAIKYPDGSIYTYDGEMIVSPKMANQCNKEQK